MGEGRLSWKKNRHADPVCRVEHGKIAPAIEGFGEGRMFVPAPIRSENDGLNKKGYVYE